MKAVVYSLGIELFASFMPRHILQKVPDLDHYVIEDFTTTTTYGAVGYKG